MSFGGRCQEEGEVNPTLMEPSAAQDEPGMIVLSAANIWGSLNFSSATMEQRSVGARGEAPHPAPTAPTGPRPPLRVGFILDSPVKFRLQPASNKQEPFQLMRTESAALGRRAAPHTPLCLNPTQMFDSKSCSGIKNEENRKISK